VAIRLRAALPDDSEFCFALHHSALGSVIIELFGPWDEAVQRDFHTRWYEPDRVKVIETDGAIPIGVLDVHDEADGLYLARIELLPERQGRGIGTALIRSFQEQGRPIRLHVFAANHNACELYERLGFTEQSESGRLTMVDTPEVV
jgi:ribosomal protein S18 acetylase RimI-like enzyme